ncbi:MAG: cytochrome c oxidase subunit I [Verrucomicrobiota bacterium]|nr:cytochrome c oxidase subunit I [Verrucomicrobiota bacterium]
MAQTVPHDTHPAHAGHDEHAAKPQRSFFGLVQRPQEGCHPIIDWLTTVDHKKIGIMYGLAALFFLLVGGVEALIIRLQLMVPENNLISAQAYNEMFTMHGTTMVFLAVMPMSAAFFNYMIPLQIGARDVAFPRMNAFSLWTFIVGGIILNLSWIFTAAPNAGWFGYAPLTSKLYTPGLSTDFWVMSLQILGVASLVASFNFITTIINMRAPGLSMMKLPVFTWMSLITAFLIIMAFPAITIALVEVMFDRHFGTHFFDATSGGKPILWQHLFWIFGHPEVYILILPAMGIISEILPTFARKPLFGYPLIIFSGSVIGFLGFTVWSHHMFTTGLGVVASTAFSFLTMLIAIPTGVKIFNWIGTLWGGRIRFTVPMLYALGFVWMFMMGGFTGVMHSSVPVDSQQQDSYFVIAHFHYVLIGGSLFALFAGIVYWFPKMTGRMMSEVWGKVTFYIMFAGFNIAFFPMHFLGMMGMPRRTHTYKAVMGWNEGNFLSTIGALILGLGIAIFVIHLIWAISKGKKAGANPWDARTLEWATESPPAPYNFETIPVIKVRDQVWANKYGTKSEKMGALPAGSHGIHMPDRSWYPLTANIGFFILGMGLIFHGHAVKLFGFEMHLQGFDAWIIPIVGAAILFLSIILWACEGPGGYHLHPEKRAEDKH